MTDSSTLPGRPPPQLADTLGDTDAAAPAEHGVEYARVKSWVQGALFGRGDHPVRIGRFTVLRRLGSGGMSVVYSAYDDELDRKVAIKILRPENPGQASAPDRLRREAQAIARLSHPNVVPIYEVGEHDGEVFLAMEFVRGTTLRAWLEQDDRSWAEVRDVLVQAGRGLEAAHIAGIVHRDFKPENVMVGEDGRVRVLDFGVAALRDDGPSPPPDGTPTSVSLPPLTRDGALIGTPAYMAPEALRGRSAGPTADQFSFCTTCWEAAVGRRPFAADSVAELLAAIERGPPSGSSELPHSIRVALARGLSVEPGARFASISELLAVLEYDPSGRWRTPARVAFVVTLGGLAVFGWMRTEDTGHCERSSTELAAAWGPARARTAQEALADATPTVALGEWEQATAALDRYADAWLSAHTSSCAHDDAQGERALHRALCFEWSRQDLRALSEPLVLGDGTSVAGLPAQVEALTAPSDCRDPAIVARLVEERARRTAPAPKGSEAGLLSDFETQPWTRFGAGWTVSTDHFVGGSSQAQMELSSGGVHGSDWALRVYGEVVGPRDPRWGGAMIFLGDLPFAPANLQTKHSLSMWARGTPGPHAVMLFTAHTGFEPEVAEFDLTSQWQRFEFELDSLETERYDVTAVFIGRVRPGRYDLRLDDVAFEEAPLPATKRD